MNVPHARPQVAFVAAVLSIATGCDAGPATQASTLPVVSMAVGGKTFQLEVAADEPSRQHGLMERDALPADHGMIFVFPDEDERSFWMHHTRFPLDIIFADHSGKVVSVHTMKPYDETNTPSEGRANYAIELAKDQASGVKAGDLLTLPTLPAAK